jgi:hypothetical protein
MHGAFKRYWPRSFEAEVASLVIVMASTAWVLCAVLGLCIIIPLVVLMAHLGFKSHALVTQPVVGRYSC